MGSSDITSLALVSLTLLAMLHSSHGQNSPQDYLDSHNSARSAVGVGPMTWDANVAAFAQDYANQRIGDCALQHSGGGGKYGENIAVGSGDFTGAAAVDLWVGERADYDDSSNTCTAGRVCGHYTQVVWRNSVRLGCARVLCNSGSWFITCNYDPAGNYVWQHPYSGSGDITYLALVCLDLDSPHDSPQDYLDRHNSARSAVGVGPMTWDANVAAFAQDYANQRIGDCALQHSGGGGKYGENIAVGSGDFTGAAAVDLWVGERADYDYSSNTCTAGRVCGHYTQVVWRNSVRLGCARVRCNSGSWFITCNYDPAGNYVGESPY